MKRRTVPNTISKRFRRKLRRAKSPFFLWLKCKRPRYYARLVRWWNYQFINIITNIAPFETPFTSAMPKVSSKALIDTWVVDELHSGEVPHAT